MRLYNDVIQESQLVYGDHTEHLNINSKEMREIKNKGLGGSAGNDEA